ncbi:MAG: arsenate reductase ArsC [Candidatus Thiodiazotropha sp.]
MQRESQIVEEHMVGTGGKRNLLVLCTGNSARSIMAEAVFNHFAGRYFKAFSAGSTPTGRVNPLALECIARFSEETSSYRSKDWREFASPDAPTLDLLLTVCDNAAKEVCPLLPGNLPHVHWGFADPTAVNGDIEQARGAFDHCFNAIRSRVEALIHLPLDLYSTKRLARLMEGYAPGKN